MSFEEGWTVPNAQPAEDKVVDITETPQPQVDITVLAAAAKLERGSSSSSSSFRRSSSSSRLHLTQLLTQLIRRSTSRRGNRSSSCSSNSGSKHTVDYVTLSPASLDKALDISMACEEALAEERRKRREARLSRWTSEKMTLTPEFRDITAATREGAKPALAASL